MPKLLTTAAVVYETFAVNPDGSEVRLRNPKRNLILDQGLDSVASRTWVSNFAFAAIGTGTNPTKRDSGATTFALAANVITASANFFIAGDVGRLLKFDSGEEVYITGYTDQTHAACVYAGAVAAAQGTIWYVNDIGLQTEVKRSSTYANGATDNGTSYVGGVYTHKRMFLFTAEAAPITYNEIGWSWDGSAGNNLFGRDVISGGDSLATGQMYKVVVRLIVTISPIVSTAVGNIGDATFDTSGDYAVCTNGVAGASYGPFDQVMTSGGQTGVNGGDLEPSQPSIIALLSPTFTLQPDYNGTFWPPSLIRKTANPGAYSNGQFWRKKTVTFGVSEGNGTIYGFGATEGNGIVQLGLKFTTPQVKDSDHTLDVEITCAWQRVLIN